MKGIEASNCLGIFSTEYTEYTNANCPLKAAIRRGKSQCVQCILWTIAPSEFGTKAIELVKLQLPPTTTGNQRMFPVN